VLLLEHSGFSNALVTQRTARKRKSGFIRVMAEISTLSEEKLADFLQKQDERFSKLLTNALLPIITENTKHTEQVHIINTKPGVGQRRSVGRHE
jgi:hypothetical protein